MCFEKLKISQKQEAETQEVESDIEEEVATKAQPQESWLLDFDPFTHDFTKELSKKSTSDDQSTAKKDASAPIFSSGETFCKHDDVKTDEKFVCDIALDQDKMSQAISVNADLDKKQ